MNDYELKKYIESLDCGSCDSCKDSLKCNNYERKGLLFASYNDFDSNGMLISKRVGKLGYNQENKRFGILSMDLWEHEGLHCGETIEVLVDGQWIKDRMEMSKEWYLVHSKITGNDLEGLKVRL